MDLPRRLKFVYYIVLDDSHSMHLHHTQTIEELVEQWNELEFTWAGKPFKLRIPESDRYYHGC